MRTNKTIWCHQIVWAAIVLLVSFSSCSKASLTLVPDESDYIPLSKDQADSVFVAFNERADKLIRGSVLYSVTLKTPLFSRTFEQGIIFTENCFRASLYAANFARLMFYVVTNQKSSLTCDVEAKEAIYSTAGLMCLPSLPRQLADPTLLLDILLGRLNLEIQNLGVASVNIGFSDAKENKLILRAETKDMHLEGLYSNQQERIKFDTDIFPERVILRPKAVLDGKRTFCDSEVNYEDEVLIEYSYAVKPQEAQLVLPYMIKVQIPSKDISIEYQTIKFSDVIQGSTKKLFDTTPPPSFRVIQLD